MWRKDLTAIKYSSEKKNKLSPKNKNPRVSSMALPSKIPRARKKIAKAGGKFVPGGKGRASKNEQINIAIAASLTTQLGVLIIKIDEGIVSFSNQPLTFIP